MNFSLIDLLFFDYVVLLLSLIIIIFSFWKGFINSVLGLLTWVGSVFITIYTYEYLSGYLNSLLISTNLLSGFDQFVSVFSLVISIPLIFILSLFILKRIRKILNSDLDKQVFGIILDKFFGLVYGIIFSYVIFSTLLYFTNDNRIALVTNTNIFLVENSNILKQISQYNDNLISIYIENNNN